MKEDKIKTDVVLIGAGIMSATIGILLKELKPEVTISVIEKLDEIAKESSDAWNNAGTGHSAFCELNYTPQKEDGSIDITKAIKIASSFEKTKEFWSYLVEQKNIIEPKQFITQTPHLSFVWGGDDVFYLRKRFNTLSQHPLFKDMLYSEKWNVLENWMPLVMEERDPGIEIAATKMEIGTDVNFGAITRAMFHYLQKLDGVTIYLGHEVQDLQKNKTGKWELDVEHKASDKKIQIESPFVFIGAGGGSLPLLEESNIEEAEGYGGFPISGQWLVCNNEQVISQHAAKVYGKAAVGSPPMSVPHLDTRLIAGKKALLFGPFAGFSTKFLKHGSYWDLATSIELDNIFPMLSAGAHNLPLTKYLLHQVTLSHEDRIDALREYLPNANAEDWELAIAGQRVQVIKKDEKEGGVLEFGTEIVCSTDGSIAALLGASPGASTAVSIMLDVLKKCFAEEMASAQWQEKIKTIIPSYDNALSDNESVTKTRDRTSKILDLN